MESAKIAVFKINSNLKEAFFKYYLQKVGIKAMRFHCFYVAATLQSQLVTIVRLQSIKEKHATANLHVIIIYRSFNIIQSSSHLVHFLLDMNWFQKTVDYFAVAF